MNSRNSEPFQISTMSDHCLQKYDPLLSKCAFLSALTDKLKNDGRMFGATGRNKPKFGMCHHFLDIFWSPQGLAKPPKPSEVPPNRVICFYCSPLHKYQLDTSYSQTFHVRTLSKCGAFYAIWKFLHIQNA